MPLHSETRVDPPNQHTSNNIIQLPSPFSNSNFPTLAQAAHGSKTMPREYCSWYTYTRTPKRKCVERVNSR